MRPPIDTPRANTSPERWIDMDQIVELSYIPGEFEEELFFRTDEPRRIGILMAPSSTPDIPLRMAAQVSTADGELVPRITQEIGQPLLRDEWDLPGPGVYRIVLFGETQPRTFELMVVSRPVAQGAGGVLAYDSTQSGEIAVRGQRDIWTFQAQAGDQIVITMLTANSDSYLELYDPDQQLITTADDSPTLGLNA
ncbi:MAG: hypothetical protein GYB65_08560 [Chloroflexi bacterium]|nr:hypothetical protein [Chloroflexota bacterium]